MTGNRLLHISIVTDELSSDPETAFELGLEWGVTHFELRGVYEQRVPRISPSTRHRLLHSIRSLGVSITAISPGLFKFPFPDHEPTSSNLGWMEAGFHHDWAASRAMFDDHLYNLLPRALEFAQEVGAGYLITFGFARGKASGDSAPNGVVEVLSEAVEAAALCGVGLLMENEEGHWPNTGERTAALVKRVNHPAFTVNWDPANALIDGDVPYPEGYTAVKSYVRNVHFKDVRCFADGNWEIVEEGGVDWRGQIAALFDDGYMGAVAVEPHLRPQVASTKNALSRLRKLIDAAAASQ